MSESQIYSPAILVLGNNNNAFLYMRALRPTDVTSWMKPTNEDEMVHCLASVWTLDGKIFAKTSPDGFPIRIFSEEDFDNL